MTVQYRPVSAAAHIRNGIGETDAIVWSSVIFEVWRNNKPYYKISCTFGENGQFDQLGWQGDDPLPECPKFVIDQMKFWRELLNTKASELAENLENLRASAEYKTYKDYRIMRRAGGE